MLGSYRLSAYQIFAISLFNFRLCDRYVLFPLSEREVVDSKPHHYEKNASTKAKQGFRLNKGI